MMSASISPLVCSSEGKERSLKNEPKKIELSYYASASRLHCRTAIGWHLRGVSHRPDQLYVEALGQFIDVMTLERRNSRLQELRTDANLPEQ
jgi:hypothetical protein